MREVFLQWKSLVTLLLYTLACCRVVLRGSTPLCLLTDESETVGHVVRRVMAARPGQATY